MGFMGKAKIVMAFMAIVALVGAADADAQPADCLTLLGGMASCLTYVAGYASKPPAECCTAFRTLVNTNDSCLCEVLDGKNHVPGLDLTNSLALPTDCSVAAPLASSCEVSTATPSTWVDFVLSSNAGTMFAPSMVMIISMEALILMKIIN